MVRLHFLFRHCRQGFSSEKEKITKTDRLVLVILPLEKQNTKQKHHLPGTTETAREKKIEREQKKKWIIWLVSYLLVGILLGRIPKKSQSSFFSSTRIYLRVNMFWLQSVFWCELLTFLCPFFSIISRTRSVFSLFFTCSIKCRGLVNGTGCCRTLSVREKERCVSRRIVNGIVETTCP